jgi:hypothetical protein
MKTNKSALLDQFLNEKVLITLNVHTAMQVSEAETVEGPMMVQGIFLDYDNSFLLVGQEGRDAIEIIKRDSILGIRIVNEGEEILQAMGAPTDEELN